MGRLRTKPRPAISLLREHHYMAIPKTSPICFDSSANGNRRIPNPALRLFSQFWRSPRSVGTVLPSSRGLARLMVEPVNFTRPSTIIEYGPGTGTFTSYIARRLRPHSRYVGIEINPELYSDLVARFPHFNFFNRSAADIESIMKTLDIKVADVILSGIPWASLPARLQPEILQGVVKSLRPGGVFVTFAYVPGLLLPAAQSFRNQLNAHFPKVEISRVIWNNFPPAFTYVCHR